MGPAVLEDERSAGGGVAEDGELVRCEGRRGEGDERVDDECLADLWNGTDQPDVLLSCTNPHERTLAQSLLVSPT